MVSLPRNEVVSLGGISNEWQPGPLSELKPYCQAKHRALQTPVIPSAARNPTAWSLSLGRTTSPSPNQLKRLLLPRLKAELPAFPPGDRSKFCVWMWKKIDGYIQCWLCKKAFGHMERPSVRWKTCDFYIDAKSDIEAVALEFLGERKNLFWFDQGKELVEQWGGEFKVFRSNIGLCFGSEEAKIGLHGVINFFCRQPLFQGFINPSHRAQVLHLI